MTVHQGLLLTEYDGLGWMVGDGSDNGSNAISGYNSEDLIIPETYSDGRSIVAIGKKAFYHHRFKSIYLPDSIIFIGNNAFDYCNFQNDLLALPASLETLEAFSFSSNSIQSFHIGDKLKILGQGAFGDNIALKLIEVSKDNQYFCSIDGCLYDKKVEILYCVPYLLESYSFPMTVKTVEYRAISMNTETVIWIPPLVTKFSRFAFFRLSKVESIHILGSISNIESSFIYIAPNLHSLYYYGRKTVDTKDLFPSDIDVVINVCSQYRSEFFSNKPVNKSLFCDFALSIVTPEKRYNIPSFFILFLSF